MYQIDRDFFLNPECTFLINYDLGCVHPIDPAGSLVETLRYMLVKFGAPSYHGLVTAGAQSQGYVFGKRKISGKIAAWGAMLSVNCELSNKLNESLTHARKQ